MSAKSEIREDDRAWAVGRTGGGTPRSTTSAMRDHKQSIANPSQDRLCLYVRDRHG